MGNLGTGLWEHTGIQYHVELTTTMTLTHREYVQRQVLFMHVVWDTGVDADSQPRNVNVEMLFEIHNN